MDRARPARESRELPRLRASGNALEAREIHPPMTVRSTGTGQVEGRQPRRLLSELGFMDRNYTRTMESDRCERRERQIVQSWLNLVEFSS